MNPIIAPAQIGFVGCGVMGAPMAQHLLDGGYRVTVFTRTPSRADALLAAGAKWADSPAAAAIGADAVITIVGYPDDVRQVYLGENGILGTAKRGAVLIDMTTSDPALAAEIAESATARELHALDAPVSGGDVGARNASLAIMVGGQRAVFDAAQPLFDRLGQNVKLMGPPGSGQHVKMCNQILIAGTMIGVCESLLYASSQGLDEQSVIDVIGQGAAGSWSINNLGPRIATGDLDPCFYVEHFVKDMEIALQQCRRANLSLPGLALVHQLYVALKAQGGARLGTQALIKTLRSLNSKAP